MKLHPGIYLGLPEEHYFGCGALGSTDFKTLATHPWRWQEQQLFPQERKQTVEMLFGKAAHTRVLEGKKAFDKKYCALPEKSSIPGLLDTANDMAEYLDKQLVSYPKSASKAKLTELVRECPGYPTLWVDVERDFYADKHPDFEQVPARFIRQIEQTMANMQRNVALNSVMEAGSLIGGAAELSVIYEYEGMLRRLRYDFAIPPIAPRTKSLAVDLKLISSFRGNNPRRSTYQYIWDNFLDIQAAFYIDGWHKAKELVKAGQVYGTEPYEGFVEDFFMADELDWSWIFVKKDDAHTPIVVPLDVDDELIEQGVRAIDVAQTNYQRYVDFFGLDHTWSQIEELEDLPEVLTYNSIPNHYDRGI